MSIKAYQRSATQADNPRELEYRAFGHVTAGLIRAQEAGLEKPVIAEALCANSKLWNVLSADCSTPGNQLPLTLRGQIISLALWVSKYSSLVLREGADVGPLIDINRTVMEGLAVR